MGVWVWVGVRPDSNPRRYGCDPSFAAPERLLRLECSLFSDVWSIGLVALELLTGHHVLDTNTNIENNVSLNDVTNDLDPTGYTPTSPALIGSTKSSVGAQTPKQGSARNLMPAPAVVGTQTPKQGSARHLMPAPADAASPRLKTEASPANLAHSLSLAALSPSQTRKRAASLDATQRAGGVEHVGGGDHEQSTKQKTATATRDLSQEAVQRDVDVEQRRIALQLVSLHLPIALLQASGFQAASKPVRPPHTHPAPAASTDVNTDISTGVNDPTTAAAAFLSDCLQKMPHHRRDCGALLASSFLKTYESWPPPVALEWIRDLSLCPPPPPHADEHAAGEPKDEQDSGEVVVRTEQSVKTEGLGVGEEVSDETRGHSNSRGHSAGGADVGGPEEEAVPRLSAAKTRRKRGEALVHEVQERVKKALVTEEETSFLRNVFDFIDKDGDGSLQRDEILQILEFLGERPTALRDSEAVEHFLRRLGLEGEDDGISFDRFLEWWTMMDYWNMIGVQKESKETAMLRASFESYDDDASGFIDVDELHNLLQDLGHTYTVDELKRMMRLICDDEEAEGLNFEQFTSLTIRLSYWKKIGVRGSEQVIF